MNFNKEKIQEFNDKWNLLNEHLKNQNIPWFLHEKILGNFLRWLKTGDGQCLDIALIDMISISVNLPKVFALEVLIATDKRLRDSPRIKSLKINTHNQICFMVAKCRYLGNMSKVDSIYYACNLLFHQFPEYELKTNSLEKKYDIWEKEQQFDEEYIKKRSLNSDSPTDKFDFKSFIQDKGMDSEKFELWSKEVVENLQNSLPPLPDRLIGDR